MWSFLKVRRNLGLEGQQGCAPLVQALSPPLAFLPFRVWQTPLHLRPLVQLETMRVYFGTAERANSSALDASVGRGVENVAWPLSVPVSLPSTSMAPSECVWSPEKELRQKLAFRQIERVISPPPGLASKRNSNRGRDLQAT